MVITEATRAELKALISQTLDEREQQTKADKYVYRRICGDFEEQLKQFDYIKPDTHVDKHHVTHQGETYISCSYRIREAIGCLLRIAYHVDMTSKLPAEKEADMRRFMSSVFGLMAELRNQN